MDNEPRLAHCLLALRRIEEMYWDTTFRVFKHRLSIGDYRMISIRVQLVTLVS